MAHHSTGAPETQSRSGDGPGARPGILRIDCYGLDMHLPIDDPLRLRLRSRIERAAASSADETTALSRTIEAISSYVASIQDGSPDELRSYSETAIRMDFIDPILRALGWDLSKHGNVSVERRIDYDRVADYVLINRHREPFAVVEAKKLYEELDKHEGQLFAYMDAAWVDIGILTNGFSWRVYRRSTAGEIEPALRLDDILKGITRQDATELCSLAGFSNNYRVKRHKTPPAKPPSPLDNGWVE
jgi:hypothetical protein